MHINGGHPQYGNTVRMHSKGNGGCSRKESFSGGGEEHYINAWRREPRHEGPDFHTAKVLLVKVTANTLLL